MSIFRLAAHPLAIAALLASATPVIAQANVSDITGPNVSDITGPNVSDITGPNVSDVTGPNVSDITGPNVSDITGTNPAGALRAAEAGYTQADVDKLAESIGAAYATCSGGGDCTALNALLDQSSYILTGE